MTRRAAAAAAVVVWLFVLATPAGAHATLEETTPGPDSVLDDVPDAVELRFTEAVDPGLGGVEVFGPDGERVDRGEIDRSEGDRLLRAPVDADQQGTYTVAWSVVSEDSHTISGSFVFSVGRETGAVDLDSDARHALRLAAGVARWTAYAGTITFVGALAFPYLMGPTAGAVRDSSRLVSLLRFGAVAALLGAVGILVSQVALASNRSVLGSVGLLADAIADQRFAVLGFARICLAFAATALVLPRGLAASPVSRVGLAVTSAGLLIVPALAGHAWTVTPRWASVTTDTVHFAAGSVWIGGLIALLAVAPGSGAAAELTRRFSRMALLAVVAIVLTGSVSGYLQVRSTDALTGTGYGKLLIAKVVGVGVVVGLGWANRRRLVRLLPQWDTVFRLVRAEVGVALIVLALTAALVNRPPARDETTTGPFSAVVDLQDAPAAGQVQLQVVPAAVGQNDIHLYFLGDDGLPRPIDAVEMTVAHEGVPPRRVTVTPITADHASAFGVTLPSPGSWTVTITAVREGVPLTATVEVPIA